MKIRKIVSVLAAAVVLASFAFPAMADNHAMETLFMDAMDRSVPEWISGKSDREKLSCLAMCDLVRTVDGTSDEQTVMDIISSALLNDGCYIGVFNGETSVSMLYFGSDGFLIVFYTPAVGVGQWTLIPNRVPDPKVMMEGLKSDGSVESYYHVSASQILEFLSVISESGISGL